VKNWLPLILIPAIALLALPLMPSLPTWVTLTVAGLAMGMMIFIMASGLTLVFGLMDVMNFAHGAFISVGAYAGASALLAMKPAMQAQSLAANLSAIVPGVLAAMAVAGALGWFFERVVVRPVYGDHLKQILVTTGGLIVCEQLIHVVWDPTLSRCRGRRASPARSWSATRRSSATGCWRSSSASSSSARCGSS